MTDIGTVTTLALIAAGGYFGGGVLTGLADGSGVRRMFSGSAGEQTVQIAVAVGAVWLAVQQFGIAL